MDLTSTKTIKELLANYQKRPSKTMGQNFLVNKTVLDRIISAANLTKNDTVLEIGPGIGTLTQALAQEAKNVIAIEKDPVMVEILKETLKSYDNIQIISGDALKYDLLPKEYKVVANIPYYLTSPIIRKFLETPNPPTQMLLMMQKEVAQRICAKPPHMSILAVSVQFYATVKIMLPVSKQCFWPAPKVDSAIISIIPHVNKPLMPAKTFFAVVKAGFSHPRKQLGNNLSTTLKKPREKIDTWLLKNDINPSQRAETLTVEDWQRLASSL